MDYLIALVFALLNADLIVIEPLSAGQALFLDTLSMATIELSPVCLGNIFECDGGLNLWRVNFLLFHCPRHMRLHFPRWEIPLTLLGHLGVLVLEPDRLFQDAPDPLGEILNSGQPAGQAGPTADSTRHNPDEGLPLVASLKEEWASSVPFAGSCRLVCGGVVDALSAHHPLLQTQRYTSDKCFEN